jgi:Flp pilus assembly protein TadG
MKDKRMRKGQSALEFALILPLFFLLLTALFDLGRAVLASATINSAVREGTRYAIVQVSGSAAASDSAIESKVRSFFYGINDIDTNSIVTITRTTSDPQKIKIHITYKFNPITPGIKQIIGKGKSLTINAESEMLLAPIARQ